MNIFTKKLAEADEPELPIDPIELYSTCSYDPEYAYLRSIQEEVLKSWHAKRDQRDFLCKMNTGSGKTLTGLLMLYSKLVELKEPALYVCPDKQLVKQTVELAKLYDIPVCEFDPVDAKNFPLDFVNAKKILVCNFHKLFNGRSIFNRDRIKIGALILDDAHKCLDIAREQATLRIPRSSEIGKKLFSLFESALKHQAQGSFHRIAGGDPYMHMKVPYWAWMDNNETIIEILNTAVNGDPKKYKDIDGLALKWNFMADNLLEYDCYLSGDHIEITPIHVPYYEVPSFHEATHRYILSATFEDDYDLIKDLGIDYKSILEPIVPKDRKDVGKRLILAPQRFDPKITELALRKHIAQYPKEGVNTVVIVPSDHQAKNWIDLGAECYNTENIDDALRKLENSTGNFIVFLNRYDGMDLHNDLCRVLVLDGLPQYGSLQEHYAEIRLDSFRAGKKAQIIEQGLGRAVRSGGDHCVVYLMGSDLLGFLGYEKNLQYFTPVTREQLKLGLNLLDGEDTTNSLDTIKATASLCLNKDKDWLRVHRDALDKVQPDALDGRKKHRLDVAEMERNALASFRQRNYEDAANIIINGIAKKEENNPKERAWYYQFGGQMMYKGNQAVSNDLQSSACAMTTSMFHPQFGHHFKQILKKGKQAAAVKERLKRFERPQDVTMYIQDLIKELQYTPLLKSKHFENKLTELGKFLGFSAQSAEGVSGRGPDSLWCQTDGHYLVLEAKSRATHDEISRGNIAQLLHSEAWFNEVYGTDKEYTLVTLQPERRKGKTVSINDKMRVLDQERLDLLHKNLSEFGEALKNTHPKEHSEEELARLLEVYKFTPALFRDTYLKTIKG